MSTTAPGPTIPDLAAWCVKRLLGGMPIDGADPATIAPPWPALVQALAATDPAGRLAALQRLLQGQGRDVAADSLAIGAADVNAPPPQPPRPRYTVRWAAEALQQPEPIAWVVEGVLSVGSVGVLFGAPGSKKTYAALHMAACVAMGLPWLDHATTRGPVLVVDEESGRARMNRRLGQVMRGLQAPATLPLAYVSLAGFRLNDPAEVGELESLVDAIKPVLLVIDALIDVAPGDENTTRDMQPVMQALRSLAESRRYAVALIHHSGKVGNGYRGSSAIAGAADLMLLVESKPDSGNLDFTSQKNRDGEPFSFAAVANWGIIEDDFTLVPSANQAAAIHYSKAEQYVIDYLGEHGASSMADLKSHADRCSENAARQAVYSLAAKKVVRRCDPGGPGSAATFELVQGEPRQAEEDPETGEDPEIPW